MSLERDLFIISMVWGIAQFLYRRFYKEQARMYKKQIEQMEQKEKSVKVISISDLSRQN